MVKVTVHVVPEAFVPMPPLGTSLLRMCAVAGGVVPVPGNELGVVVEAAAISVQAKLPYELPKLACKTSCCEEPVPDVEVTITHWHDEPCKAVCDADAAVVPLPTPMQPSVVLIGVYDPPIKARVRMLLMPSLSKQLPSISSVS